MADDDIDPGGPIVGSEVGPAPSEFPRVVHVPDKESREQLVKGQLNAGLGLMAHGTEDASDFIKERQTQERFLEGQDLSPQQMREWHERTHAALQRAVDARAQALGEPTSQQQAPQELPGYVAPDAPDYDERYAEPKERFSNYFDVPEKLGQKEIIAEWVATHDPKGVLTGHFLSSEWGPQMVEALAGEPGVIQYLANLPPQIRAGEMKKLEGYVAAQHMNAQQNSAPLAPEPRRVSQAPPPISSPRGAANVPKDLFSLATKSDVKDYVETRRKQEHQAWQAQQLDGWRR